MGSAAGGHCTTPPAPLGLLHFTPTLSLPCLPWRKGFPHRLAISSRVGGLPYQHSITSLQETPGPSSIPGSPWFVWVLQKPLSSLSISGSLRHLQSPSSSSGSLQPPHPLKHCCWSCPSCHPSQWQACSHGARDRRRSRRSEGGFMPFFPPWPWPCVSGFTPPQTETRHPLQAALEIFHVSGFPVAQLGPAGCPRVPRAQPQWGNHR